MTATVPAAKPRITRSELMAVIEARHDVRKAPLAAADLIAVGVRGYYRDTMGAVGSNDRGIYDDAIFIVGPDNLFVAFNANTDPSRFRPGKGTGASKGMACLKPGAYGVHRVDKHKGQYDALCQRAGVVTVIRDGNPPYPDTGSFGINIHRGGNTTTSSEGCQTIPPAQWPAFIATIIDQLKRLHGATWRQAVVPYVLLDGVPS